MAVDEGPRRVLIPIGEDLDASEGGRGRHRASELYALPARWIGIHVEGDGLDGFVRQRPDAGLALAEANPQADGSRLRGIHVGGVGAIARREARQGDDLIDL